MPSSLKNVPSPARRAPTALTAMLMVMTAATLPAPYVAAATQEQRLVERWRAEWPATDFTRHSVPLRELRSGGPPKDGIPAIDDPRFIIVNDAQEIAGREPVISLNLEGEARAYPLRILIWHEIVNDTVGDTPIAVTYCPLCNAAIVFDRRLGGRVLDFGVSGKLRHFDLVMYDRPTQSWWQQVSGEAIVGALTGSKLDILASRLESWQSFKERFPQGRVLIPRQPDARPYGINPYRNYDSSPSPFLSNGVAAGETDPLARVVAVAGEAWSLDLLAARKKIVKDDLELSWRPGQASALDTRLIEDGREVGNVAVRRKSGDDGWQDAPYLVTFAFIFRTFYPEGILHR